MSTFFASYTRNSRALKNLITKILCLPHAAVGVAPWPSANPQLLAHHGIAAMPISPRPLGPVVDQPTVG